MRELGVETGAALGQVLTHDRHREVREVAAADRRRERELVEAGGDRAPARLGEHLAPALGRDAPALDVRARELAPVVEELGVLLLQRLDLALDELVDVDEQLLYVFGNR